MRASTWCFDLYATLITSDVPIQGHREIAHAVASECGLSVDDAKRVLYPVILEAVDPERPQRNVAEAITQACGILGLDDVASAAVVRSYDRQVGDEWHSHSSIPESMEVLRLAHERGIRIALVSNCMATPAAVEAILARLGLLFLVSERFLSSSGHGKKPDVEWFRRIAAKLHSSPQDILMIGDHHRLDIAPALEAGWQGHWITDHGTSWIGLKDHLSTQTNGDKT